MNIQVPWKIRLKGGSQRGGNRWSWRKHPATAAPHRTASREEDLDHLGALHKTGR